jgi:hypothetical protein
VQGGLASKNGVDFFPEEFLPDKKKVAKKVENESKIRQSSSNFQSEAILENALDGEGPHIILEQNADNEQ